MKKFFKEICLLDQPYVKDGDMSVQQYTDATAKSLAAILKLKASFSFEKVKASKT